MYTNPFVAYLNRYTTVSPEHEAAFDEFITQTCPPSGKPLRLETKTEQFIRSCFQRKPPPSIILTGNAGDGKTYLCRQIIETFTGQPVTNWADHVDRPIEHDGLTLRIVKDLSEMDEETGATVLWQLALAQREQQPKHIFLIAANEGRLRAVLGREKLTALYEEVSRQLRDGPTLSNERLIILDLNKTTTSTYVPQVLAWLTDPVHWEACRGCPAIDACPIRFNAIRLAHTPIASQFQRLYQILEHLDLHVTIRDMLIHMAYILTGGLPCAEVIEEGRKPDHELHRCVYYQNCWGEEMSPVYHRKLVVVHHLRQLDVGRYTTFKVDDFIINGGAAESEVDRTEYERLFAPAIDLKGQHFTQRRNAYLRSGLEESKDELFAWLSHCRRKLFFERQNTDVADQQIPFLFLTAYLHLLTGNRGALDRAKEALVLGLNRAFTGLFVFQKDALYVTSQYARTIEQPVPVVMVKIPTLNLELKSEQLSTEAFDCDQPRLQLHILHPQGTKTPMNLNLLRFEYLMRLARGGTYNVLAEECNLFIRNLKDRLLTTFGAAMANEDRIEFFGVLNNRYTLKTLYIDEHGKLGG